MSIEPLFSRRNPWFVASVGATVLLFIFAAIVGFVWLPSVQKDAQFEGLWNAICSAAGVPQIWDRGTPVVSTLRTSTVIVVPDMLAGPSALSIGRGATLSLRCTMCHGVQGISDANTPNLAGQYATSIYKELQDFKTGARKSAIMAPLMVNLGEQDMKDLAAYYAYLPRLSAYHPPSTEPSPAVVLSGSPMRNIAPCASCHGGLSDKAGSPWLEGQSAIYLRVELDAFATGARHNDISGQMRNVARQMTPAEIDAAARYYSNQP